MQTYEAWEVGLRRRWHRTREPRLDWTPGPDAPFVTVQVPTYAEPPEIVIGTLDALARLDYPNFEVLVIDNNTADEQLWRPVEQHCALLGSRFRFLHVEGITGAKAGALNWSRPRLDPRTGFVALVDADYQVEPNWLADTVGLFDVTTGYEWAQATEMVSRNEHDAGLTVGTMSLIRLETLDVAGGWGEPFQTEDSEFAIRAHAAGYTSMLINRRYGRGLIPETLAELKKQHANLYLKAGASRMSGRQRFRHGHYGLVVLATGLSVLSPPITVALLASMLAHHEIAIVDTALLVPFFAVLAARRVLRWQLFRREIGTGFANFVGGGVDRRVRRVDRPEGDLATHQRVPLRAGSAALSAGRVDRDRVRPGLRGWCGGRAVLVACRARDRPVGADPVVVGVRVCDGAVARAADQRCAELVSQVARSWRTASAMCWPRLALGSVASTSGTAAAQVEARFRTRASRTCGG